jgi:centractin
VVIGTKVGRAKHMRIMPGGALETEQSLSGPSSVFVGKKLDEHRGSFILEYPMDKGYVVDGGWDAMESLWEVRQYVKVRDAYRYVIIKLLGV